ncbi:hypothetical protein ACFOU2_22615 [Bacillus songklensis]|uniref:Uncharacterized protein n=1 Tax=Bacillus songklensis TaxID=1069116 RepID=A0ABV8B719_9BACI
MILELNNQAERINLLYNGHALNAAGAEDERKVNGWNDDPDGFKYKLDHVDLINVEQLDIDDDYNSWTGERSWKYDGRAHYCLCYRRLQ